MASHGHHERSSVFSLGMSVEAAEYDNGFYVGNYQGIRPALAWSYGRFGASASIGLYHLTENGRGLYGAGDAMLAGHATVFTSDAVDAGILLHAMLPTGSRLDGFGMGHAMAMPSGWATWRSPRFRVMASAGYTRALVALGGDAHDHGAIPLVDPMNWQELTWSAGGDLAIGHGVRVGGRTLGGIPIGSGVTRVIGAGRVAWDIPRVSTGFELQLGLAGDPFSIRGVVDTAIRF